MYTETNLLATLPLDLLADVLVFTRSTKDILAVARCSKHFCQLLTSPTQATFIWKRARRFCFPRPMPNPPGFMTESAYAAFVFDAGECEICHRKTKDMYISFALKLRICAKETCRAVFRRDYTNGRRVVCQGRDVPWIPKLESPHCLDYSVILSYFVQHGRFPTTGRPLILQTELGDPSIVTLCFEGQSGYWYRERIQAMDSDYDEYTKQCAIKKNDEWMKFCIKLNQWRFEYLRAINNVKLHNRRAAKSFASRHGYSLNDIFNHTGYGGVCRRHTKDFDKMARDGEPATRYLNLELLTLGENRRQKEVGAIQSATEAYYHRLRSRSPGIILPPLTTFQQLPAIRSLLSLANRQVSNSMNDLLEVGVLRSDLVKWESDARNRLAADLGYPNWATATKRILHPVDRLTACFQCKKCIQAGRHYKEGAFLDFKGVCAHECESAERNGNKLWTATNFVRDEKAIAAVRQLLALHQLDETRIGSFADVHNSKTENPSRANFAPWFAEMYAITPRSETKDFATREILCISCEPYITLAPEHVVNHCHRHDAMQMKRLEGPSCERQIAILRTYPLTKDSIRKFMNRCRKDAQLSSAKDFSCRHCLYQAATRADIDIDVEKLSEGLKKMTFNGIRLHVKAKHGIEEISDEDVLLPSSLE